MADRHVLYKTAAKEIAHEQGLAITSWPSGTRRWRATACTSTRASGTPRSRRIASPATSRCGAARCARRRRSATARRPARTARARSRSFRAHVNSYKRFIEGTFAPTAIGWALDNRTAGFRIVGRGSRCARVPRARRRREPVHPFARCRGGPRRDRARARAAAMLEGNLYGKHGGGADPAARWPSDRVRRGARVLHKAFGDDVMEHYLQSRGSRRRSSTAPSRPGSAARYSSGSEAR